MKTGDLVTVRYQGGSIKKFHVMHRDPVMSCCHESAHARGVHDESGPTWRYWVVEANAMWFHIFDEGRLEGAK